MAPIIASRFRDLIDDFYDEIERHPAASKVITGGPGQVERLKGLLQKWLTELFQGPYDLRYVERRWRVGMRHVEIGLPQVYTAAAFSRLRNGMIRIIRSDWREDESTLSLSLQSLNKLLDLDLAIISDAYETEYVKRQQEAERRRLHDVLHQEKELSSSLLAHAQAAVLVLDHQGRVVRCNTFMASLSGLPPEQVQSLDWFEHFLPTEERTHWRNTLLDSTCSHPARAITASSTLDCDGRQRHVHWSAVPLYDTAGKAFGFLVIGHDITDLHEAQQRSLQAERLAAIGQMATGLAHESRNALQRIGASAEMLELEVEGNTAALELLARIQQSQIHLHKLLDEVRGYAAPVVLDVSACSLTEVWREAWALLYSQRKDRQVQLKETLLATDHMIECDRFRLVQVFRNILDNALAACRDPVELEIKCEMTYLKTLPAICVRVRDNGPGMTSEQRRRIFEPFYTTKPTGTGLGMAIVHRIIEAHSGTITINANRTSGTEIVVTLLRKQPST